MDVGMPTRESGMNESLSSAMDGNKDPGIEENPNQNENQIERKNLIRIVHISDTHGLHQQFLDQGLIPNGDILVHSGDFCCSSIKKQLRKKSYLNSDIQEINDFFSKLPHQHKILIGGNHEMSLGTISREKVQNLLKNCIYLQDSSVVLEGVKFYGAPWNIWRMSTHAQGFSILKGSRRLQRHWDAVPDDADVMITHNPSHAIMDVSRDSSLFRRRGRCEVCGEIHPNENHWGCELLRRAVHERVRPVLHLHGHTHSQNGVMTVDGVTVSNSAMKAMPKAHVFDVDPVTKQVTIIQ